jgi:hypothetical protein
MVNPRQVVRALVFALSLSLFSAASVSVAYGQQLFTLTVTGALSPFAVDPGSSSTATIEIAAVGAFDGAVSFDTVPCTVTPVQPAGTPVCSVSPDSVTPPGQTFLTITTAGGTSGATPPGLYTITVTGTSGASSQAVTLTLNVVNVTEDYTLSVPTTATPSPVPPGSVATAVVSVSPIASYAGSVTLACLSVSPVVAAAPYCSFSPATVQVTSGFAPTSTLTITTLGPTSVAGLRGRKIFYGLWLLVPGLVLVGLGKTGTRGKSLVGVFLIVAVAGGLLLMPACGSTYSVTNNAPNGEITPKNTYTFTLTGADQTGAAPSNTCPTGQTCGQATVTLVVN